MRQGLDTRNIPLNKIDNASAHSELMEPTQRDSHLDILSRLLEWLRCWDSDNNVIVVADVDDDDNPF